MTDRTGHTAPPREKASPTLDPTASNTTWIVVAASVIGVLTVLLVGTTIVVTRSGNSADEPRTSATGAPATPTATTPPPAKGSTNIECDGSYIVEIAVSEKASDDADVKKAAAKLPKGKFLDASASCSTYSAEGYRRVAYVGPFDTLADACKARVKAGELTAMLRQMDADERGHSYCACTPGPDPVLQAGAGTDGDVETLLTIGDVQRMLKALGFYKPKVVGDPYGPRTIAAVQDFQIDRQLVASGIMDQATWKALKRSEDDDGDPFC